MKRASSGSPMSMIFCSTWLAWGQRKALATWPLSSAAIAPRARAPPAASRASCTWRLPPAVCDKRHTWPRTAPAVGRAAARVGDVLRGDSAVHAEELLPSEVSREGLGGVDSVEAASPQEDASSSESAAVGSRDPPSAAPLACSLSCGGRYAVQLADLACGPSRPRKAMAAKFRPTAGACPQVAKPAESKWGNPAIAIGIKGGAR